MKLRKEAIVGPEVTLEQLNNDDGVRIAVGGITIARVTADGVLKVNSIDPNVTEHLHSLGLQLDSSTGGVVTKHVGG